MSKVSWPTPQDYNEAVQNPRACFSDPDLMHGQVATNAIGLPRAMTGAFASVYKIVAGDKSWAVRCFLTNRLDQRERYKLISDFVLFDNLPCTIDFFYLDEGIKIKGNWYPCLKMPWVEGDTIDQYITKQYKTPGSLKQLLTDFHDMIDQLEKAGIGHGDLQHGNILVTNEGLRLVDYDALYVPALAGRKSLELGHPNYQHPDRNEHHYDQDVDNFSCWLIHASLLAIAIDPLLYERHGGGDECLLFRRHDLARPEQSKLFEELKQHSSEHLREAAVLLERMLWAQPLMVPILDCPIEHLDLLPTVRGQHTEAVRQATAPTHETDLTLPSTPLPIRNRFDFIDDDALVLQAQVKRKQSSASHRLAHLKKSNKKLVEEFYLWLSPHAWTKAQMHQALALFDRGNYDDALSVYLNIYRTIGQKYTLPEEMFWCMMGMGYCSGLSDKTLMAGNYFLLASKNTESLQEKLRAALCLAVNRYDSKECDAAFKVLSEHFKGDDIVDAVKLEMRNIYVLRSVTYHLLRDSAERLLKAGDRSRAASLLLAMAILLDELIKTRSIETRADVIKPMITQAMWLYREGFHRVALKTFNGAGELCLDTNLHELAWEALLLSLAKCGCCFDVAEFGIIRVKTIQALANSMKNASPQYLDKFANLVDSITEFVGAENLRDAIVELTEECFSQGLEQQAAKLMIIANRFTSKQEIAITPTAVHLLMRFPEKEHWPILRASFFEDDKNLGQIIDLLGKCGDVRILARIGIELAREQKTVLLSAFCLHIVFYCPSTVVDAVFSIIVGDCKDGAEGANLARSLTESTNFFMSELETLTTRHSLMISADAQRLLNAVLFLRTILQQLDPDCDVDWIADTFVLPRYSSLVSNWLLSLVKDNQRKRLTEFLQMLINRCGVNTVGEFIVGLTMSDDKNINNDLEAIIAAIRAWGVSKEELSSMLRPAIQHCISQLEKKLSDLARYQMDLNRSHLTNEAHQLRSLYQLLEIARESQLGLSFETQIGRLYSDDNLPALSFIATMEDIDKQTLCGIALDMASHKEKDFATLALKLAKQKKSQSLTEICQTLLKFFKVSQVVSLCGLLHQNDYTHFFPAMCRANLSQLPDKAILALSQELRRQNQQEFNGVLIRELKAAERPALLIQLICQSTEDTATDGAKGKDVFAISHPGNKEDFSDLTYASSIAHMAALSGDDSVDEFLDQLECDNVAPDERIVIFSWAALRCRETLRVLSERLAASGETSDISEIAMLNMSALERLFLLCETATGSNEALSVMHDPVNRPFFVAWIKGRGLDNDISKLAFLYMRAARLNETSALTTIVIELAQLGKLRMLISLARQICASGYSSSLAPVLSALADAGLTEAFGALSLELVTSTADRGTIKQLLQNICEKDPSLIRVLLRQIAFYRGPDTLVWLCKQNITGKSHQSCAIAKELKSIGFSHLAKEILPA